VTNLHKKQIQAWLLRLAGTLELLAFFAVVMPRAWMEIAHVWLGLGTMPRGPIIMFMIRQASYTYGMHGIVLWVLSLNVDRFRPLIVLTGITYLIAGPVFFLIDHNSDMPLWWTIGDAFGCGLLGVVLLWLSWGNREEGI